MGIIHWKKGNLLKKEGWAEGGEKNDVSKIQRAVVKGGRNATSQNDCWGGVQTHTEGRGCSQQRREKYLKPGKLVTKSETRRRGMKIRRGGGKLVHCLGGIDGDEGGWAPPLEACLHAFEKLRCRATLPWNARGRTLGGGESTFNGQGSQFKNLNGGGGKFMVVLLGSHRGKEGGGPAKERRPKRTCERGVG